MAIKVMRVFEYSVECDHCTNNEVYHTGDQDNGIRIHDMKTAKKASGYKLRDGELLCPACQKSDDEIRRNAPWR